MTEKNAHSLKVLPRKRNGKHAAVSPGYSKTRAQAAGLHPADSPRHVALEPLGSGFSKPIPMAVARKYALSPLAARLPVGDIRGDFVRSQLEPMAELFIVIHPMCLKDLLERLEIEIIRYALIREKGNVRKASALLGVKYTTLYFKVQKYRIQPVLFETLNH